MLTGLSRINSYRVGLVFVCSLVQKIGRTSLPDWYFVFYLYLIFHFPHHCHYEQANNPPPHSLLRNFQSSPSLPVRISNTSFVWSLPCLHDSPLVRNKLLIQSHGNSIAHTKPGSDKSLANRRFSVVRFFCICENVTYVFIALVFIPRRTARDVQGSTSNLHPSTFINEEYSIFLCALHPA